MRARPKREPLASEWRGEPSWVNPLAMVRWGEWLDARYSTVTQNCIETGLDVDRLIEVAKIAEDVVGRPLPGHVMRGGTLRGAALATVGSTGLMTS